MPFPPQTKTRKTNNKGQFPQHKEQGTMTTSLNSLNPQSPADIFLLRSRIDFNALNPQVKEYITQIRLDPSMPTAFQVIPFPPERACSNKQIDQANEYGKRSLENPYNVRPEASLLLLTAVIHNIYQTTLTIIKAVPDFGGSEECKTHTQAYHSLIRAIDAYPLPCTPENETYFKRQATNYWNIQYCNLFGSNFNVLSGARAAAK